MDKIKVLMIDDNINLCEMVKEYFKDSKKIEVVNTYHDGEKGLEGIKKDTYDVILLDLIMPNKDGLYVLESLYKNKIHKI